MLLSDTKNRIAFCTVSVDSCRGRNFRIGDQDEKMATPRIRVNGATQRVAVRLEKDQWKAVQLKRSRKNSPGRYRKELQSYPIASAKSTLFMCILVSLLE